MLSYYAERLNSVEINSTFYRMPTPKLVSGWAARVPAGFTFVLKAPQRITHRKKLKDADEELDFLVTTASELGSRLGPILFQLPPWLKKDTGLLRDFVSLFPEGLRAAFEFRSSSWFVEEVYDVLARRELAVVVGDTGDEKLPPVVVRTGPYGYGRLRRVEYEEGELKRWAAKLVAPEWDDLYVFFKHEDAGTRLAGRFVEVLEGA